MSAMRTEALHRRLVRCTGGILLVCGAVVALGTVMEAEPGRSAEAKIMQKDYGSPKEAALALYEALKSADADQMRALLGPDAEGILESGDAAADAGRMRLLAMHMEEGTKLVWQTETRAVIHVGNADWPFPIPLVKRGDRWRFDTAAGRDEILTRRIGKDEIDAIAACRAYVEAQREYAREDRDGDGVLEYAQRIRSTPGKQDGLFWFEGGLAAGPWARLAEGAVLAGHAGDGGGGSEAQAEGPVTYHGYHYRVLTRQGSHAPAGSYDYRVRGHMVGGFALVAWPTRWGNSGIMTFMVNQDGRIYEKNLGARTGEIVRSISAFDPDPSWTPVRPREAAD